MRQGSDRMRGDTGRRREERQNDASISFIAASYNRSRSSFSTSRDHFDMRWGCEAERCEDLGRMRRHTEPEGDELAEAAG
jgi:hypothetical protein